MPRMRAVQVAKPNANLEVVEREIPDPKPRQVRIKIQACGLGIDGKLLVVGASGQPIEVQPLLLIGARRSIAGWPSGTAPDSEDTLKFGVQSNVRPMIETFPLAKAADAYQHMMSGKARFRVVLIP